MLREGSKGVTSNSYSSPFGQSSIQATSTAVIAVFVRNFANRSRALMTKNSSPIRLTSTSLIDLLSQIERLP